MHLPMPSPAITESGWAELQDRVNTLEAGQKMIASGHVLLVEQMAEITVSQRRADVHRAEHTKRLAEIAGTLLSQDEEIRRNRDSLERISEDLNANTRATRETLETARDLRDFVITAKTSGRFAKWLAPTLIAVAAAVGVLKGWWLSSVEWLQK